MKRVSASIPWHVVIGIVLFLAIGATTVAYMRGEVNSPDEAANHLFAHTWSTRGVLYDTVAVPEPAAYPLFPRSTAPHGQIIVPVGFVGLPILYGALITILGDRSIWYATLVLTACAAYALRFVAGKIFDATIADVSFWFFLFQPAVIYYSVRGLFPNMASVDFFVLSLAAAWYGYARHVERAHVHAGFMWFLACIAVGGAIWVRPFDAAGLYAFVCISAFVWGTRAVRRVADLMCGVLVAGVAGLFFLRQAGALAGAYSFFEIQTPAQFLFPFGFHAARVVHTVASFGIKLFFPWALVGAVAIVWWLWRVFHASPYTPQTIAYVMVLLLASVWLCGVYGSWYVVDNPADPRAITMGSSYVRYWLPLFVLVVPVAAWGIVTAMRTQKFFLRKKIFTQACLVVCALAVGGGVWRAYAGVDGLYAVTREVRQAQETVATVQTLVPAHTVLAVRAWDKHFYPTFPVLQPFPQDVRAVTAAGELIERGTPVYAFVENFSSTDMLWLHTNGLGAEPIQNFGIHTLYELTLWGVD